MSLAPARKLTPVPSVLQHRTVAPVLPSGQPSTTRVLQANRPQAQLSLFDRLNGR